MEFVKKKKIDCKKITSIQEIILILDSLDLHMDESCEHWDKLKHLLED